MSSSQWYTIHCAACQGHDLIGRPCRGRQIPLQPDCGSWFTVDSLAAALHEGFMRCNHDRHYCADPDSPGSGHLRDARKLIQAAKEASDYESATLEFKRKMAAAERYDEDIKAARKASE